MKQHFQYLFFQQSNAFQCFVFIIVGSTLFYFKHNQNYLRTTCDTIFQGGRYNALLKILLENSSQLEGSCWSKLVVNNIVVFASKDIFHSCNDQKCSKNCKEIIPKTFLVLSTKIVEQFFSFFKLFHKYFEQNQFSRSIFNRFIQSNISQKILMQLNQQKSNQNKKLRLCSQDEFNCEIIF
eukprot:TRINITY_DN6401_c0_g2_i1.p2 TRINITY_DN6401_c0_g2~~TRINITY_DN6401_c0_g2_i1.p2  ORF type:complete len:181 (-),score=6.98 TRINITY_DN6401_c0_g2_i1:350-892(-)